MLYLSMSMVDIFISKYIGYVKKLILELGVNRWISRYLQSFLTI